MILHFKHITGRLVGIRMVSNIVVIVSPDEELDWWYQVLGSVEFTVSVQNET